MYILDFENNEIVNCLFHNYSLLYACTTHGIRITSQDFLIQGYVLLATLVPMEAGAQALARVSIILSYILYK